MSQAAKLTVAEYLTVKEASAVLGVSADTLRYWDRTGKLKPRRNPLNGYRLYRREDLDGLLEEIAASNQKRRVRVPQP